MFIRSTLVCGHLGYPGIVFVTDLCSHGCTGRRFSLRDRTRHGGLFAKLIVSSEGETAAAIQLAITVSCCAEK